MDFFEMLTGLTPDDRDSIWYQVLAEGFKGLGFSQPNPSVGCVILDVQGQILAKGYHAKAGQAHAEIEALNQIDPVFKNALGQWVLTEKHHQLLKDATVFISLEPCAHQGRTPACAFTLSCLPLKKVCYLLKDPNPLVAGQGKQILQAQGIEVECVEEQVTAFKFVKAARYLHTFFLQGTLAQQMYVTLKIAASADGFMGLKNGQSQWITAQPTRQLARHWRGLHDAVMTGVNTVLQDNPFLDVRETPYQNQSKKLFVWDSQAKLLTHPELNIFKSYRPEQVILLVQPQALALPTWGPQLMLQPSLKHRADFLSWGYQLNVGSLWIEGGPKLTQTMLQHQLAHEVLLFQAPCLIGAQNGLSWTEHLQLDNLSQAPRFTSNQVHLIQGTSDILWRWS